MSRLERDVDFCPVMAHNCIHRLTPNSDNYMPVSFVVYMREFREDDRTRQLFKCEIPLAYRTPVEIVYEFVMLDKNNNIHLTEIVCDTVEDKCTVWVDRDKKMDSQGLFSVDNVPSWTAEKVLRDFVKAMVFDEGWMIPQYTVIR